MRGGASFADIETSDESVPIEEAYIKLPQRTKDYKWGAILTRKGGIPLISKDREEWSVALGYIIEGQNINGWQLADEVMMAIEHEEEA